MKIVSETQLEKCSNYLNRATEFLTIWNTKDRILQLFISLLEVYNSTTYLSPTKSLPASIYRRKKISEAIEQLEYLIAVCRSGHFIKSLQQILHSLQAYRHREISFSHAITSSFGYTLTSIYGLVSDIQLASDFFFVFRSITASRKLFSLVKGGGKEGGEIEGGEDSSLSTTSSDDGSLMSVLWEVASWVDNVNLLTDFVECQMEINACKKQLALSSVSEQEEEDLEEELVGLESYRRKKMIQIISTFSRILLVPKIRNARKKKFLYLSCALLDVFTSVENIITNWKKTE